MSSISIWAFLGFFGVLFLFLCDSVVVLSSENCWLCEQSNVALAVGFIEDKLATSIHRSVTEQPKSMWTEGKFGFNIFSVPKAKCLHSKFGAQNRSSIGRNSTLELDLPSEVKLVNSLRVVELVGLDPTSSEVKPNILQNGRSWCQHGQGWVEENQNWGQTLPSSFAHPSIPAKTGGLFQITNHHHI